MQRNNASKKRRQPIQPGKAGRPGAVQEPVDALLDIDGGRGATDGSESAAIVEVVAGNLTSFEAAERGKLERKGRAPEISDLARRIERLEEAW